ncbi:hypothetical protein [Streptomyces sp. NPDC051183]|uniref:hypothetical protein n=1 Tax=Streptomyces sp. NPDC051183 TaxID=3155165 RepID=UPI0034185316
MTTTAVSLAGRTVLAGLLCAALAACGTTQAGQAAGPAPVPGPAKETCGLGAGAGASASPDVPTEEQTGGYAGPPTDQETGGYAGPPTDQETGPYTGPPTDEDTGTPGPPTDQDTGIPDPPTDEEDGIPDPPTDGDITNGAGPCGARGWFDMTRDFNAYFAKHRTQEDAFMPQNAVRQARVRKVNGAGEAAVYFHTRAVGKGEAENVRRVAAVFAAWRHEVYGDKGTLTVSVFRPGFETYSVALTESW